jgi:hypothetical protein
MTNPLLVKLDKNQHGQRAEKRAAARLGGRQQPGSGNQDHSKADIKLPDFLIESKATLAASLSIKLEWLATVSTQAAAINREPALLIQFVDGQGRSLGGGAWVMVPERVFKEHMT